MKFKNWPYWVRGGVVSIILAFLYLLYSFPLQKYFPACISFNFFCKTHQIIELIFMWPAMIYLFRYQFLGNKVAGWFDNLPLLVLVINIAYVFAIGAFLGWLYGKIKNRRKIISN